MANIAMLFGSLLTVLGIVLYVATDRISVTALIPSFFGIAIVALGRIAELGGKARMHAMHGAALVGVIGLVGGIVRAAMTDPSDKPWPFWGNVLMALLCAGFVGFCVKSFIDVRRARQQKENPPSV